MDLGSWGWKGLFSRALELPSAVIPGVFTAEVSPTQRCRLRYNDVDKALEVSIDGAAYVPLSTGIPAAGGWTDDGLVVRLTTVTDQVGVGTALPAAGVKMQITGGSLFIEDSTLELGELLVDPAATSNQGSLYTKDVAGVTQLFYEDSAGIVSQLTPLGAASGWTDDGANVRLTTAADTVSVGTATPIAGTKVVVSAPQLVTAGLDTTQGIDLSIVRTAPLVSGEFVTAIAIHPSGDPADAGDSFVTGIFADVATGGADRTVMFVLGDAAGANFWEQVILSNDNDIVLSAIRQSPGAPNNIVLSSAGAAPSGEIRLETDLTGVAVVHLRATDDGATAASAWHTSGELAAASAVSVNNFSPAGLNAVANIYLDNTSAPAANINVTGLAGGRAGREITIFNVSADPVQTITLTDQDAASAAGSRFITPNATSVVIPQFGSATLRYDNRPAVLRWRVKATAL